MRSTQQYTDTLFSNSDASKLGRKDRLEALEKRAGKSINPPEHYLDAYTLHLMDEPCNIKPDNKNAPDIYIDASTRYAYETHPGNRDPEWRYNWSTGKYTVNKELSAQIEAWLRIKEISADLLMLEETRKADPVNYLQAATTTEILLAYGRVNETIPAMFCSTVTGNRVMTLPVKLDGLYIIDFQELKDHQPKFSETEQLEIIQRWEYYFKQCQNTLLGKMKQKVRYLEDLSEITLSAEQKRQIEEKCNQKYCKELAKLKQKVTLQWFINSFCHPKEIEYINPLTNLPVQSIEIAFDLLNKIDNFLDPLQIQIRLVKKQVASGNEKPGSYAKALKEANYPTDKIPESLAVGRIPGNYDSLEIMTYPVLLDGEFMIDFHHLVEYWESKSIFRFFWNTSYQDYNPFTGKPLKSITYDCDLKKETDHFMKHYVLKGKVMNEMEIRSGKYRSGLLLFSAKYAPIIPGNTCANENISPMKYKV